MLRFEDLVNGLDTDKDKVNEYFLNFFTRSNYKQYEIEADPDKNEKKAIRTMFESKKDLKDRVDEAFVYDPFCLEAFFVYYIISDDVFVNFRFETYYKQSEGYADMSEFRKNRYLRILDFYVEFLLDIHNITNAIKVQRLLVRLSNDLSEKNVNRLSFMYSSIEEADDFYRLYLDAKFDAYDYLLLLVTLLKHDEKIRAKEVLFDMYQNIKYSDHLDHLWDLELEDPEQNDFYKCVEDCYSELSSVPDFFSWVNIVNEERQ